MAIARKPQSHQSEVESFIARGKIGPSPERRQRLAAIIRFPPELLSASTPLLRRAAYHPPHGS
jgi:hypothetical protein